MFGGIIGGIVGGILGGGDDEPEPAAAPEPVYNASSGRVGRMLNEGGDSELTTNSMTAGVRSANAQVGGNKYAEKFYNTPEINRRERALTSFR